MAITCSNCGKELTVQQAGEPCPNCQSLDRNIEVADRVVAAEKALAARELARRHYEVEPGLTRIVRMSGSADMELKRAEPIKILEVNENTAPAGVMPLHFGPAPASGISFPSVIIEVTPEEYERILAKELKLPEGWQTEDELPR